MPYLLHDKERTRFRKYDVMNALERIQIGLEKKEAVQSEERRTLVAWHEAGHAVVGALMNDYDAVTKISIVPRGPTGGVTIFMPSEERLENGLYSKEFLENRICVALGGRIAEEMLLGKANVTTGASGDFQQCTQVAKTMVMKLGMSEIIGQRSLSDDAPLSQALRQQIDSEVKRIVDEQYARGKKLLESNEFLLRNLSNKLLAKEKVNGDELVRMIHEISSMGKLVNVDSTRVTAITDSARELVAANSRPEGMWV